MQQHRVSEKGPAAFGRVLSISQERASPMPQKFPAQPRSAERKLVASASASRAPEPICWRSRIPRAGTNLLAQPHPARRNQTAGTAVLQQACMPPARFLNPPREQPLRPAIPAFLKSWKLLAMVQLFSYFSIREPLRLFASAPAVCQFPISRKPLDIRGFRRESLGIFLPEDPVSHPRFPIFSPRFPACLPAQHTR